MIRQFPITVKTVAATLAYTEMGDVIVNPGAAIDITLPAPLAGLWYRVTNISAYTASIKHSGSTVTTIGQNEHAMVFANGSSGWYFYKAAGPLTKAQVEAVLTGEISSHTHPYTPEPIINSVAPTTSTMGVLGQLYIETTTPTIYYCSAMSVPTYTWTELSGGGGGASAFTDLTDAPSSYSGAAGKVVKVNSSADGIEFGLAPAIVVLGMYATLGDLQTAHPAGSAGDAYAVGTDSENVIYIWDTGTSAWSSIGPLKGEDGEDGSGAASTSIWGGF